MVRMGILQLTLADHRLLRHLVRVSLYTVESAASIRCVRLIIKHENRSTQGSQRYVDCSASNYSVSHLLLVIHSVLSQRVSQVHAEIPMLMLVSSTFGLGAEFFSQWE